MKHCIQKLAKGFAILTTLGILWLPGVSSAEDVWCCSREGRTFYLDSESINAPNLPTGMDYRVSVKTVLDSDGSLEKSAVYGFEAQNDVMVGMTYDKSAELWKNGEASVAKAVWEAMKPYLRQKRISYSDAWAWE